MSMEKFLFLDLDDTVFQTARKCSGLEQATPASYNLSGEPSSYFLPKQRQLLNDLAKQWRIIPTTARTMASYSRVKLGVDCVDGAILNHGGTILDNTGAEDKHWREQVAQQLSPLRVDMIELKALISDYAQRQNLDILVRITTESALDYYVEIRHKQANFMALQGILTEMVQPLLKKYPDFEVYLNSNSLTILPLCVNKQHAVAYKMQALKQHYGEILTMGMGDSLSDAAFMGLCDYVMTPQNSQLHRQLI